MKFSNTIAAASLAAVAAAAPTGTVVKRATECAQYATVETGSYTIYNNLWGESAATSGSQCLQVTSLSGSTAAWASTWSWAGGVDNVKSYANAVVSLTAKKLSAISSMESTFDWSYSGTNVVADVSYDMFTAASASGSSEYEIMIWLAALGGAGPISSTYGSDGDPTPIATPTIAGHSWKLYKGPNGDTTVFSFVASSEITAFSGDVKAFFTYLVADEGLSSSQYLTSVGAGTEAFTGSNADFKVSAYSMVIS
ncbi:hypothetical protein LTR36_000027 [Oleoguttula mirabilis]|uniref:Uncharacterized protein n=1 Tax=Oleoguttula mirabilis TaxID=1507867 RepID=A0AAV9JXS4_9PEZI|nr:hypothetical protein LTR36_000027 [Oleoguttula mirabilis]